jgi:hypothetical protein
MTDMTLTLSGLLPRRRGKHDRLARFECPAEQDGHGATTRKGQGCAHRRRSWRPLTPVRVRCAHPLFAPQGDDPLDIADCFGECWVVYRCAGYKDENAPEAQNTSSENLLLAISKDYWDSGEGGAWGTVPEVAQEEHHRQPPWNRDDLDVSKVKAVCKRVNQVLSSLQLGEDDLDREVVLEALSPGNL